MTFTTALKEEISKTNLSLIESQYELMAFIKCVGKINSNIVLTLENAAVARRIYRDIKSVLHVNPIVTIRLQKRFRVKQIYIITIKDDIQLINEKLSINFEQLMLASDEEKIAFIEGTFLAIGNVTNPQTGGYHLEFICNTLDLTEYLIELLQEFNLNAKMVQRGYKYVVYLKSSDNISTLIKMFKATNALFFFEDIRIYRDHKNMVNRLNNCELSNQTKTIETGLKQLNDIEYLRKHDLIDLLDENTKIVIEAREKYSESSLAELADIITMEYNYRIGKSGVNHHFIKIKDLVKKHKNNNEESNG